ncbi:hypothetical protein CHS0354_020616, partial [Potamilus streckersoni]
MEQTCRLFYALLHTSNSARLEPFITPAPYYVGKYIPTATCKMFSEPLCGASMQPSYSIGSSDILYFRADLFFHIAEYENNRVLSADEAKRFLDGHADELYNVRFENKIISIESSLKSDLPENESTKTTYVLAAVIGLLALVILIVGYMFFSSSNRYKRKLRAAMPTEKEMNNLKKEDFTVPGCNVYANRENPLLKAEPAPPGYDEIDATSHNSLDENE